MNLVPAALGALSSLACASTLFLSLATGDPAPPAQPAMLRSGTIAAALPNRSEPAGGTYLSFRLEYVPDADAPGLVPIEAAAQDVLTGAVAAAPALTRGQGWREALERTFARAAPRLGVTTLRVIEARRVRAHGSQRAHPQRADPQRADPSVRRAAEGRYSD